MKKKVCVSVMQNSATAIVVIYRQVGKKSTVNKTGLMDGPVIWYSVWELHGLNQACLYVP